MFGVAAAIDATPDRTCAVWVHGGLEHAIGSVRMGAATYGPMPFSECNVDTVDGSSQNG